jgi:NitT/TauT family transport system ATP-binding protein
VLELEVRQLSKTYGTGPSAVEAIDELTFSVNTGEFVCILGPSGCGKTTLLKCLSGLLRPTTGSAFLEGQPIDGTPDRLALVFQDYSRSLLPWMTVRGNVTLPLLAKGMRKTERQGRALEALSAVGLDGFENSHPWQLSGGMQQRVAIARALAYEPRLLLMDEPFASVDAQTRADLEDLVRGLHRDRGMSILFVTHDIDESVYLGERVIVLSKSPTWVQEDLAIDLAPERDQITTRALPRFTELRTHVYEQIQRAKRGQAVRPVTPAA